MTSDVEHAYGWSSQRECDSNKLKGIGCSRLSYSPTEADIWFRVLVEKVTQGTDVRGRIVGPRSLFTETAERVSPLRSVKHSEAREAVLTARTAFPHPSLWSHENPSLYRV